MQDNPIPQLHPPLIRTVEAVLSHVWLPRWYRTVLKGTSPPEDQLALVLMTLLWSETQAGRITVTRHARLEDASFSARHYEVDLLLHQPSTGAWGAIEVDGWTYHRRDRVEFDYELRRDREIRYGLGLPLVRYSAREVMQAPWSTGREVLGLLGSRWPHFQPLDLPDELLDFLDRVAEEDTRSTVLRPRPAPAARPLADGNLEARITGHISSLPLSLCADSVPMRDIRERYPRGYEPWGSVEEDLLLEAISAGQSIDRLAGLFQRQPGALRSRAARLGHPVAESSPSQERLDGR